MNTMVNIVFEFVGSSEDEYLCFVSRYMLLLSIPRLPSDVLIESVMVSTVSVTMQEECAGTINNKS